MSIETAIEVRPLTNPVNWPPPALEPPSSVESILWRVPVIGWIVAYCLFYIRLSRHRYSVLLPLENEIVEQLAGRPPLDRWPLAWPQTEVGREVVSALSQAIAEEKGISSPTIHPDDSVDCLFWGAFDDLTPMCFRIGLSKRFGGDFKLNFNNCLSWTAQQLVSNCEDQIGAASRR